MIDINVSEFVDSFTEDEFGAVCAALNWINRKDSKIDSAARLEELGKVLLERAERDLDRTGVSINSDALTW